MPCYNSWSWKRVSLDSSTHSSSVKQNWHCFNPILDVQGLNSMTVSYVGLTYGASVCLMVCCCYLWPVQANVRGLSIFVISWIKLVYLLLTQNTEWFTNPSTDGWCLPCALSISVPWCDTLVTVILHTPPSSTGSSAVFFLAYSKRILRKTEYKQAVIDLLNQTSLHVSNMKRQQTSLWLEAEYGEERKG